jgi:hypothetical protein
VRFTFTSEPIVEGRRCNCSFCVRRGAVVSAAYLPPEALGEIHGREALTRYRFGDQTMDHYFCRGCGVAPFSVVSNLPEDYQGSARPGYHRINLGCVPEIDVFALPITLLDGKSF